MPVKIRPPVCNYEGSDYQTRFWDTGGRDYEDRCEAIALKRLLPQSGKLILELGAGAGRNTPRYHGFERVVLLDYSRTQLKQARERLGTSERYIYVAADIYRLPFVDSLFDATTMIRTLHHMADAPAALRQVRNVLQPGATFILEYANKRNLKAILRFALRLQTWNQFALEPVEFAPLNFDFHPKAMHRWLEDAGFRKERILAVSHFRIGLLKRIVPPGLLAGFDSVFQWTGALWQFTPSVFIKSRVEGGRTGSIPADPRAFFKCPECGHTPLTGAEQQISCPVCKHKWNISDGIYDFRGE
ncbi:MAG: methyltransferase domain-containing protein [Chloroflexi bacterium]|nr:methyltransferase domain-containing protein [Chloroflexota bacterium]